MTSPKSSPFFRVFQMVPALYPSPAKLCLQIALSATVTPDFETYTVNHSTFVQNIVRFVIECLADRKSDRSTHAQIHPRPGSRPR
jgi:hypothetical protein